MNLSNTLSPASAFSTAFATSVSTCCGVSASRSFGRVLLPAGRTSASVTEDPARRRANGGGSQRWVMHLIPMSRPEIVTTAAGPAVFHADFSPVTGSNPARAGEALIVTAIGLGPTRPGVNPGEPFPLNAPQEVNSDVEAMINGKSAAVLNKIGWPGATDTYRIDVRVPEGTPPGTATIRLSAAWIAGSEARIPLR